MTEEQRTKMQLLLDTIGEPKFGIIGNNLDEPKNGAIGIMDAECATFIDMSPHHTPERQKEIAGALCALLDLCFDLT